MAATGPEVPGQAAPPPRRGRRRAVGPAGAVTALSGTAWDDRPESQVPEGDDERLLRDVPPHHVA